MVRISLDYPKAGWVFVRLNNHSGEFVVTGSHALGDVLRDFVDAIQSLQSTNAADCCWFQEPGELHWSLRRRDQQLEIEIIDFPDTAYPGLHRGEATTVFKAQTSWHNFATQVLESLEAIEIHEYEKEWRFRFPREAYQKLRKAIG